MRDADKGALVAQTAEGLLRREALRYQLLHEKGQQLSLGGHNFFTDNDQVWGQSLQFQRARDRVVIGDRQLVDAQGHAGLDDLFRPEQRVLGVIGVGV